MRRVIGGVVILTLILSLAHCQLTYPYVSFMDQTLANHAYVNMSQVGNSGSFQCITDLETCCRKAQGPHRGDWYFPDGNRIQFSGSIYENRQTETVYLYYIIDSNTNNQEGIYRCGIATNAVHHPTNSDVRDTVYVGLYKEDRGKINISGNISMSVNGDQFTFTCISTGGPATTVTWTRDSTILTEVTETVLNDAVTAQYTHTLMVYSTAGHFTCTVSNNISTDSTSYTIGPVSPNNVEMTQNGPTSVTVSWTHSVNATGYRISYGIVGEIESSMDISGTSHNLTDLQNGETYRVSVVATSDQFNSSSVSRNVPLVPESPSINNVEAETTNISLSWNISSDSVVTQYVVEWVSIGCGQEKSDNFIIENLTVTHYTITGLRVGTNYNLTVRATNEVGNSQNNGIITTSTMEEAPSASPSFMNGTNTSSTTITIEIGDVPCSEQNGDITGYSLNYTVEYDSNEENYNASHFSEGSAYQTICNRNKIILFEDKEVYNVYNPGSSNKTFLLSGLRPSTNYSISVAAHNSAGVGVSSRPLLVETNRLLSVLTAVYSTSINVSWELNEEVRVTSYTIFYYNTNSDCFIDCDTISGINSNETGYTLSDLEEATNYSITVIATIFDIGETSESVIETIPPSIPSASPSFVNVRIESSTSVAIFWKPIENCRDENGRIINYSVSYGTGDDHNMEVKTSELNITLSDLTKNTIYTVRVAAITSAGMGDYSSHLTFQTPDTVFLSLKGEVIPNHGYINSSEIGNTIDTALLCQTSDGDSSGGWFAPDKNMITNTNGQGLFIRGDMVLRLMLEPGSTFKEGIYKCTIGITGGNNINRYVGIYSSRKNGVVVVSGGMSFQLQSTGSFTLTCVSTGGPATNVTWTKDSVTITEITHTEVKDQIDGISINRLDVKGRLEREGVYRCFISNPVSNVTSLQLNVTAPPPPSIVAVLQNGFNSAYISWEPGDSSVIEYKVSYSVQGEQNSELLLKVKANESGVIIRNLEVGVLYTVNVTANSAMLPSLATELDIFLDPANISIVVSPPLPIMVGENVTLNCSVALPDGRFDTPTFTWIGPSLEADSTQTFNESLILRNIQPLEAGPYTCDASLGGSIVTTKTVRVHIPAPIPTITYSSLTAGMSSTFVCNYSLDVDIPVTVSALWTVNGEERFSDLDEMTENNISLIFSPLETSYSGTYKCQLSIMPLIPYVEIEESRVVEKYIDVQIPAPTVSISLNRSGVLYAGTGVSLSCCVTLDPSVNNNENVSIDWMTDGDIIQDRYTFSETKKISEAMFTRDMIISPLALSDASIDFICTGTVTSHTNSTQSIANSTKNITVEDLPDPVVSVVTNSYNMAGVDNFELTCNATTVEYLSPHTTLTLKWSSNSSVDDGSIDFNGGNILSFSSLMTSHAGIYTCQATLNVSKMGIMKIGRNNSNIYVQIPTPEVMVMPTGPIVMVAGSSHVLFCNITPAYIGTSITVRSNWTKPDDSYTVTNGYNDTSPALNISNVNTADRGVYNCSAIVYDSDNNQYILPSQPGHGSVKIVVKLNVSVIAIYTPAPGVDPSTQSNNEFVAGSSLKLNCTVKGNTHSVMYNWTVGPYNTWECQPKQCVIRIPQNKHVIDVGNPGLLSYFASNYTCSAMETDTSETLNMGIFPVRVIGAGLYAKESQKNVSSGPIQNNGVVVSDSNDLWLDCSSNSSKSEVGRIIPPHNNALHPRFPYNRPGTLRLRKRNNSMSLELAGIYTCIIPDNNGNNISINVGLYPYGFSESPRITNISYDADNQRIECVSTNSPATSVTWMKDGGNISIDGTVYTLSQNITNRSTSTYSNILQISKTGEGVAGEYTCTVSNALGSNSKNVTAVGIKIIGLEEPLVIGESATISCTTDEPGTQIELRNMTSQLANMNVTDVEVELNYTINLVTDDMHGDTFFCTTFVNGRNRNDSADLEVSVPLNVTLAVEADPADPSAVLANKNITLICTVREEVKGLTKMPSARWISLVTEPTIDTDITQTVTVRNDTVAITTLHFPSINTSQAGLYICQGELESPAVDVNITKNASVSRVSVELPAPTVTLSIPRGPLYEGTVHSLNCTATLPPSVDTHTNTTMELIPQISIDRVTITPPSGKRSPFDFVLTVCPLAKNDTGSYSCNVTTHSSSQYIVDNQSGGSTAQSLIVIDLPPANLTISFPEDLAATAGESYRLNCSAVVVENLVVKPNMSISFQNSTLISTTNTISLSHSFSSLNTSDGGQYNCAAVINIPQVGISDVKSSVVENITVRIPKPNIIFSGNLPFTSLYSATLFNLTCQVELSHHVNTPVNVRTNWLKDGIILKTFNSSIFNGHIYESVLRFDPLSNVTNKGDSGIYTCSVTIANDVYIIGTSSDGKQELVVKDLPPPMVQIISISNSTAGSVSYLECVVETVDGVRPRDISITWTKPDGLIENATNQTTDGNVTTGRLNFLQLSTSDGGVYCCTGRIQASSVGVNVSTESSPMTVRVTIPPPQVSVSITNGSKEVSQGTKLVLTCSADVHPSVNTNFIVNMTWNRVGEDEAITGEFVNVSMATGRGRKWTSTLTISPVNLSDTANYSCESSVYPNNSTFVGTSQNGSSTVDIHINALAKPEVTEGEVLSTAGEYFTTECNFTVPQHLVAVPIVKWLSPKDSNHSLVSNNSTLSYQRLNTSHGGEYTCVVNITISVLGISLSGNATVKVRVQIPEPLIVFKNNSVPFSGTNFTLSCIVTMNSSVDTNITIDTHWKLPNSLGNDTIANDFENDGRLKRLHNITFSPLRSNDSGVYVCNASITPKQNSDFVMSSTAEKSLSIEVEKLPLPDVLIDVSSTAGLGEEQCLQLDVGKVSNASNAVTCGAGVVPKLFRPPNITLWRDGSQSSTNSSIFPQKSMLTENLNGATFYCRVCIHIPEFGIENHCRNQTTVTSDTKPEPVHPVTQTHNDTHMTVSWSQSDGSVVRYILDVEEYVEDGPGRSRVQSIVGYPLELPTTDLRHNIQSLRSEVPYIVTLVAGNGAGCGSKRSLTFFTKEGAPKTPPHNVAVEWLPDATAMRVSFTRLSIVEANSINITYTIRYSSSPFTLKRESQIMMVEVKMMDNTTVIGGLSPTLDYHVVVDATNNHGTMSSTPQMLQAARNTSTDDGAGGVAAGVVVALLLILVIAVVVGLVFFFYRRKQSQGSMKKPLLKGTQGLYTIRPIETSEMMEMENRGTGAQSLSPRGTTITTTMSSFTAPKLEMDPLRMGAIAVEEFEQHCINYHQSRDAGFETEYETLAVGPLAAHEISQTLYNKQKNRFANIYPYDETRVVLTEIPEDMGSDYINASWINGYKHPNAYIASQGPKTSTVGDFWRMIWEYKVTHIVMVTGLCEGGRVKCDKYWSDEVGGIIDVDEADLKATTTSITTHRDFVIRTIIAKKNTDSEDEKPLSVTQFHFTSWPDHGVPKFATSLVSFIRRVQKSHDKDSGVPLLVHCSAGVGRTGTFILLDSMLERIKEENTINVYEFLVSLRKRRVLMVQTQAQYAFVHDALCEVIKCGDTEISATRLREIIDSLSQPLSGDTTITGFQQQFELLDKVSRKPSEHDFAIAREHPTKNRYREHLPYTDYMACLKHTEKEDSYINASFIDGYKHHRAYLATQGPLQNTVCDIWRMMWEFRSKVMVMLCSIMENGDEACHPFWPNREGDTVKYGKMTVTLQSENAMEGYSIRKLSVLPEQGEEVGVTQFHMTSWPEDDRPSSNISVLELLEMVTKAQMNSGTRPITVLCNDGVGRTGTFICLHSQLERLKTEGVVDIFQAIKSARIQRAGIVQNMDQYVYCHEVLADFVNSYDNYANFKEMM